jgi:predicted helicase
LIISTTDKWGKNAEDACDNQQIPVQRIGLADIAPPHRHPSTPERAHEIERHGYDQLSMMVKHAE